MMTRIGVLGLLALASGMSEAAGQHLDRFVVAGRYESYSIAPGVGFRSVSELTVPVGLDASVGNRLRVSLSSGYAMIDVTDEDGNDASVSGVLDTELRVSYHIVPGSLIFVATGVIPTGINALDVGELPVLGALASEVIGFAAPNIGSGGSFGGGLIGAVPIGRWALGLGANYKYSLAYEPFVGQAAELRVGPELRLRAGVEGPVARRTFLRFAGVLAMRGKDEFQGASNTGIGHRFIGYFALNQGLGNSQLTVYTFDVYRGNPQVEPTAVGGAVLPKGNLLAGGFRLDVVVGQTTITPRMEGRVASAPDAQSSTRRSGRSVRFGVDITQPLSPQFSLRLQGDGVYGDARRTTGNTDTFANFDGYRVGLFLTARP